VKNEIEIKTERLREMLNAENLGGVLLNSQHNFAWLSGGKSNGINLSIENGACFLFVRRDGKKFVLANNIEMPRILSEEISAEDFEPIKFAWQEEKSNSDLIFEKTKSLLDGGGRIASDLSLHKEIRPIENLISRCRYELTEAEIERYRRLGKDAGIALGNVIKIINPGETEIEIARKTRNELAKFNCDSVVTLVGADERIEKFRHPIPTENNWKKVLLIAVCAKRKGLIASLSRIVCTGEIPDVLKRKTEAAAFVFAKILSETKRENTGAKLYETAVDAYAEKGFADEINKHHQGGAAGYKTRDWVIYPQSAETVFPNQAFAFNPSITGTKSEETALLINDEIEIITASPDFPQISIVIDGREYFSPGILSL
jgi:Xaa-Pro dipeptidase